MTFLKDIGLTRDEQHMVLRTIWKEGKNYDNNFSEEQLKNMPLDEVEFRLVASGWQNDFLAYDSYSRMNDLLNNETSKLDMLIVHH